MGVDKTLKRRYEMKYLLSVSEAAAIKNYIKSYIQLDDYSNISPDGFYPIVSLYFDSKDLSLCRESLTGKKNRYKLRIRSYSDDISGKVFIEIKRRMNSVILKDRATLDRHLMNQAIVGKKITPLHEGKMKVLEHFNFYNQFIGGQPVILIGYLRKAYEDGRHNQRLRITFDKELSYKTTHKLELKSSGMGWNHALFKNEILEIKFTGRYPNWVDNLIKIFNLKSRSVSKYTTCVQSAENLGFCGIRRRA